VPDKVANYIGTNRLYGAERAEQAPASPESGEKAVPA
jgi:hypothetical protein